MSAQPPDHPPHGFDHPEAVSPFGRLVSALSLSKEAFRPRIRVVDWLVPLLLVIAVAVTSAYLLQDLAIEQWHKTTSEQIDNNEQLTPEQREDQKSNLEGSGVEGMVRISTILSPILAIPLACLLAALLLTLVVGFGLGGTVRFGDMWPVACLAWTPHLIRTVLVTILALSSGNLAIRLGPAALVPDEESVLASVLGVFDLFDIWMLGIHFVGVAALTNLSKGRARTAVLVLWITYWVLAMALVVLGRKLQGIG